MVCCVVVCCVLCVVCCVLCCVCVCCVVCGVCVVVCVGVGGRGVRLVCVAIECLRESRKQHVPDPFDHSRYLIKAVQLQLSHKKLLVNMLFRWFDRSSC